MGPLDSNNERILTQSFVHRTHLDVFGVHAYYPAAFRNWYSDNWATRVYGRAGTQHRRSMKVLNSQAFGTRYEGEFFYVPLHFTRILLTI